MSASRQPVLDLWAKVRTDRDPLRWVVAKGNDKLTDVELCASGTSGLSGMVAELKSHEGIMFGGIRVAAIDERGTVTSIRPKFIKFMLITSTVGGMKRAKAQGLQVIADDIFQPTHCSFNIDDIGELTPADIQRKLTLSAGAHLPNRYEFEGREEDLEAADAEAASASASASAASPINAVPPTPPSSPLYVAAAKPDAPAPPCIEEAVATAAEEEEKEKAKAAEEAAAKAAEEEAAAKAAAEAKAAAAKEEAEKKAAEEEQQKREAAAAAAAAEAEAKKKAQQASSPKPASPLSPASPTTAAALSSITDAWAQVQSDSAAPNFLVVACEGRDEKSAKVVACENGSLEAFKAAFDDDYVMFGGFRMRAIDDRGSVLSIRTKYIFVSFIGGNVKPLLRANAGTLRPRFEQIFSGCHLTLSVSEADDIVESEITTKLLACGGAHSPNTWDYSGRKNINEI